MMTPGKTQLAPQTPLDRRVITIARPQRADQQVDADDPLLINVIRRRWLLLTVCLVLSLLAAVLVAARFRLPKAITTGQLRYVALPPTLQEVYEAPQILELVEVLKSNECMAQLAQRAGLQLDLKSLRERFEIEATPFSNIIDLELRWQDGKQAIDMVNTLMRISCETTAASRKHTLSQYAVETDLQYESAHQKVVALRERVTQLRQEREARLNGEGGGETETKRLIDKLARTEDAMDDLTLRRVSFNRQLATLRGDLETLEGQIREELLKGRRQQVEARQRLYNPNSEQYRQLAKIAQELTDFEADNRDLDYTTWRAKLETVGRKSLGELETASLAAVTVLERKLAFNQSKIEQIEFELLPLDGEWSLLDNQRESLERRLADAMGSADIASTDLEEAEAQLEEAMVARSRLLDQLSNIRRGEETDFSEMTILTPASWQTTETSEGKLKLFVFTLGGCFLALVMPVFALEHFFPSGDPADAAAKALGVPHVSRGTFLAHRIDQERRQLHPVNSEAMRLLALRIQQSVHGPGAIVLFSGLNHDKSAIPMISYLAECLSRREERVLIVDACDRPNDSRNRTANEKTIHAVIAAADGSDAPNGNSAASRDAGADSGLPAHLAGDQQPGLIGLSDFLHRRDLGPNDMICPTSIPGVDIISAGSTSFPREGLASSSLTALFEECRQRYTLILVAGPSTNCPSDLQMLSARADAILFTVPSSGRPAGKGEEVVRDLLDLGAPVIGIVS
jgi:hypothetical protein